MDDVFSRFIDETKYPDLATPDQLRGKPKPPFELPVKKGQKIRKLPDPRALPAKDLGINDIIERWEPGGFFHRSELTLDDLSYLLWCSQGVRIVVGDQVTIRNVYSCESIHPLETYCAVEAVEGLAEGLYRYLPLSHRLVLERKDPDIAVHVAAACMNLPAVVSAAVTMIWCMVPYRGTWALGRRGYRAAFLDCGHACQQLICAAAAIGCGVRPIDLFHDDALATVLGADTTVEQPVYCAAVGRLERLR